MPDSPAGDLADQKAALRRQAQARRAEAAAAVPDAGARLRDHLLAVLSLGEGAAISAYWPMRDEISPVSAMEALHAGGHAIGLPVMPGRRQPLVFRAWHPGQELVHGGFGTRIPPEEAPEVIPQVLLVPLLAFDRAGYRLGYGGGFYDRTLAKLRRSDPETRAVGVAYAAQEVAAVPHDEIDQRLDLVVTEAGPVPLAAGGAG